jgi:DNA-binding SARP family transcriptional activator/tetratricopeptide (TPR) repeat protein
LEEQTWVRVLGPVEVHDRVQLQPQSRLLLALLALSAGQVLPQGDLVDALWGQRPPPSARASLQILATRSRKALAGLPSCAIERHGDGYRLHIRPALVDVHRFRLLVTSARQRDDDEDAIAVLGQALALWRGPALADVPGTERVEAIRHGLAQEHLAAVQYRFSRLLAAGRDGEAAAEIPAILASHPLAERLAGMLMIASYRCGRQDEALQVFRDLRARLADELGVDPGPEMQRLHEQILSGDPELTAPHGTVASRRGAGEAALTRAVNQDAAIDHIQESRNGTARESTAAQNGHQGPGSAVGGPPGGRETAGATRSDGNAVPGAQEPGQANGRLRPGASPDGRISWVPLQLPAAPAGFAGRLRELRSLTGWLDDRASRAGPAIVTISGIPGVGKTALALYWAHQEQRRFPDGQLYVNLGGFDASPSPVSPTDALAWFLESLGVPASQVPAGLEARASLYRSLLAGKRMLIMLDNARDEAQVRPLLPGSAACMVLATSRNHFTGLVAAEGARPLVLDVLAVSEAGQLLASRLGTERVKAEPLAAAGLISLCSRLPLALAIAAARAATRPALPLAAIADELRDAGRRLDSLDAGDPATSIKAVFSWSRRLLSDPAARMFRLLGTHPGPDISAAAAASLAAIPEAPARSALSELARASLAYEQAPDRFTLHDLLRAYAAELADDGERHSSLQRVLDFYLHTAHAAVSLAYPAARQISLRPPEPGAEPERLASPGQALAWLRAEHRVLLALATAAGRDGFDAHAWQLPAVLQEYLARHGHYRDWAATQREALAAAARLGDEAARADAHRSLADALIQLGSWADARHHLRESLSLYRSLGGHAGLAGYYCSMDRLSDALGDHTAALQHARRALRIYRMAGDQAGQATALNGVGWYHALMGNTQKALSHCNQALAMHRAAGNRFGEATTLDSLGYCHHQAGRYDQAASFYRQALVAYADDHYYRAHTLTRLGDTYRAAGDVRAARDCWLQAAGMFADLHQDLGPVQARLRDSGAVITGVPSSGP